MQHVPLSGAAYTRSFTIILLTSTAVATLSAGCSPSGRDRAVQSLSKPAPSQAPTRKAAVQSNQLEAATSYWAGRFRKNQKDPEAAWSYAMNLRAMGKKKEAFDILEVAHKHHPNDPQITSAFGRLAADLNRTDVAEKLLDRAVQTKMAGDWRTLSARGAVHAKKGEYAQAQRLFEAALEKKPNAPAILNNLALAYAMDGKADRAEPILRQAMASGYDDPRVRQNLALVLGLQGKFGEAKQVAAVDLSGDEAGKNTEFLRNMVRDEIKMAAQKRAPVVTAPKGAPSNVHLATAKEGKALAGKTPHGAPKSLTPPNAGNGVITEVIEPVSKPRRKPTASKSKAQKKKLPFRL